MPWAIPVTPALKMPPPSADAYLAPQSQASVSCRTMEPNKKMQSGNEMREEPFFKLSSLNCKNLFFFLMNLCCTKNTIKGIIILDSLALHIISHSE